MIFVDNVPADKLREQLATYNSNDVISVVVSRYVDGWAMFYQIIYRRKQ